MLGIDVVIDNRAHSTYVFQHLNKICNVVAWNEITASYVHHIWIVTERY